jgi:hypothetical protein
MNWTWPMVVALIAIVSFGGGVFVGDRTSETVAVQTVTRTVEVPDPRLARTEQKVCSIDMTSGELAIDQQRLGRSLGLC